MKFKSETVYREMQPALQIKPAVVKPGLNPDFTVSEVGLRAGYKGWCPIEHSKSKTDTMRVTRFFSQFEPLLS